MAERWRRVRKRLWAGVLGAVLLAAWGAAAAPVPGLGYTTTSAEAGAPARYGFLLPGEASKLWAPGEPWTLVFDGALDVAAYQRRLRLCYARHSSGLRPAHSRCLGPIPATIEVSTASGEDRVTITPTRAWEANRPLGVWVDLINPMDPGTYEVQLLQVDQPLARWHLRVEQPGVDSPGAP